MILHMQRASLVFRVQVIILLCLMCGKQQPEYSIIKLCSCNLNSISIINWENISTKSCHNTSLQRKFDTHSMAHNSNKYGTLYAFWIALMYWIIAAHILDICIFSLIAAWIIHQILSQTFYVSVLTNVLPFVMKCIVVLQHFKGNLLIFFIPYVAFPWLHLPFFV